MLKNRQTTQKRKQLQQKDIIYYKHTKNHEKIAKLQKKNNKKVLIIDTRQIINK